MATVQELLALSGTTALAMRTEASLGTLPETLKALPNLPPGTIATVPLSVAFNVPFIPKPPEPLFVTIDPTVVPLYWSKEMCKTGVLSTTCASSEVIAPIAATHKQRAIVRYNGIFILFFVGEFWLLNDRIKRHCHKMAMSSGLD